MYSKAKIKEHPIHPMLVAYPIAFYTLTLIGFAMFQFISQDPFWYKLAYFSNLAGIGTALLAAVPGFIDWFFGIPRNTSAKKRGLIHAALNITALVIFSINAGKIWGTWNAVSTDGVMGSVILSAIGVLITMAAGYQGWELIGRHKVGVYLDKEQERIELSKDLAEGSALDRHTAPAGRPRTT